MKIRDELKKRIERAVNEKIDIVPYDPKWKTMFQQEAEFLKKKFPTIIKKVEHIGSTVIPNLSAKPIIDMLIEVTSFKEVKKNIVPALISLGYDYFWRPEIDKPPMYAWFIKRNSDKKRTHHLHMIKTNSKLWERLLFRNYLREFKSVAKNYEKIKKDLAKKHPNDREKYTKAKSDFIQLITHKAKKYYKNCR